MVTSRGCSGKIPRQRPSSRPLFTRKIYEPGRAKLRRDHERATDGPCRPQIALEWFRRAPDSLPCKAPYYPGQSLGGRPTPAPLAIFNWSCVSLCCLPGGPRTRSMLRISGRPFEAARPPRRGLSSRRVHFYGSSGPGGFEDNSYSEKDLVTVFL